VNTLNSFEHRASLTSGANFESAASQARQVMSRARGEPSEASLVDKLADDLQFMQIMKAHATQLRREAIDSCVRAALAWVRQSWQRMASRIHHRA
jgi:hypothetical protein